MIRPSLIYLLVLGIITSLNSQTQISNIDNQVPYNWHLRSGIENIEGEDYLLEINNSSLKVSKIQSTAELIYEVSDFPQDDEIHWKYGKFTSRSGFYVDSLYLYEIFKHQIRKRNLLTSEIVDIYSFPNEEISSISAMEVVDNIIHFEKTYNYNFATYNITTKEFTELLFLKQNTQRSKHLYISYSHLFNSILKYNAEDKTTSFLFENEFNLFHSNKSFLAGQKGLIFSTFNSSFRFISTDTSFLLNCEFDIDLDLEIQELFIHETEDHYVSMIHDAEESTIRLFNKLDCSVHQTYKHPKFPSDTYIQIFDTPSIQDDYLLFALNYGSFASAQIMLLDKNEFKHISH